MANGSFILARTGNTSEHITFTCNWVSTSNGVVANSSTVKVAIVASKSYGSNESTSGNYTASATVNGSTQNVGPTNFTLEPGATITLLSKSYTVPHNADGTKSTTISATVGGDVMQGNGSANVTLDKISRYATVTQVLNTITETSITINWGSDSTVDRVWYSINNGGNWSEAITVNSTSGSYTINGLTPETTYNVKTRVRRKDSQLMADSTTLSAKTYAYPYATSMPSFTIGSKITLGFYNPLERRITVNILGADGSQISNDTTTGTSISGYNGEEVANRFYASIPNAKNGTYRVKVTYGTQENTKQGGTYTINTNDCKPSIGVCSYLDTNNASTLVTENNQLIVRSQSRVQLAAANLIGNKSATILSCQVVINANSYNMTLSNGSATVNNVVIDSARDVTATFTATDSRGITTSKDINITMLDWILPTAIINLHRQHNFYSESDINVNAEYSSIDGKNAIEIKTRYKKINENNYSGYVPLQNNVTSVLTLDNLHEWNVQVLVSDRFGSTTYNLTLGRGMPIMFIDRKLSSVGFNCFPKDERSVEVNGISLTNNIMTAWLHETITNLVVDTYTTVPLTNSNSIGNKLTFTPDGGIKIGGGVNYVKVSAILAFNQIQSNAARHIRITKIGHDSNSTLGWAYNNMVQGDSQTIAIPPMLAPVQEGDVIYLRYYTPNSNDSIGSGNRTSLTVETV
jgi:hypothetical protein